MVAAYAPALGTQHDRVEECARALLTLSVELLHHPVFFRHPTARGDWESHAAAFRSRTEARGMNLRPDLLRIRMANGCIILEYFSRGQGLVWELLQLGVGFDDKS